MGRTSTSVASEIEQAREAEAEVGRLRTSVASEVERAREAEAEVGRLRAALASETEKALELARESNAARNAAWLGAQNQLQNHLRLLKPSERIGAAAS